MATDRTSQLIFSHTSDLCTNFSIEQAVAFIIPISYRTSSYDTTKLQLHQTKYNYERRYHFDHHHTTKLHQTKNSNERRLFIQSIVSIVTTATVITIPQPSFAADALLMDKSTPSLQPFSGDNSEAREWFALAIKDIDNLLSNYDEISMTGGDNVRLYLGTQGTKSHMYGISKVLKSMKEGMHFLLCAASFVTQLLISKSSYTTHNNLLSSLL